MANERDISDIITTFLLNTCRLPPRLSKLDIEAAINFILLATDRLHHDEDKEGKHISLITGSVAEFYIEPMLHYSDQRAIPRGYPPPTQLPAEFHKWIRVCEIIDSHLPGYVYLRNRYLLTQSTDDGKYLYRESDERHYFARRVFDDGKNIDGPAVLTDNSHRTLLSIDYVHCLRCLQWPTQAADWPTRHRNYGWPDTAILDRVVSNGCDVVGVAHRQCRQDEWMGKRQWRLSFSRAEIVLINSWMPVQQIVNHMLRYFIKTERLTVFASTLSNYHIKTLMLWACELKPTSWWTENLNLVRICVELLQTLFVWVTDTRCPHYFINNCNLVDNSSNLKNVASKFMSIDEEYLSTWFVNNYIGQCAQLCPVYISRLLNDVTSGSKLRNAVSEIVRWRLNSSLDDMWNAVNFVEKCIPAYVSMRSLSVPSCVCWINELTKFDKLFSVYFTAVALLHVACKISRKGFSDELTDIVETILGRNFIQCCSVLYLRETELNTSELVHFLQKSAVEHLTTYRQLTARDFGSVVTIVTTDYEALHAYKRGDYQRCLQLSTQNAHALWDPVSLTSVPTFPEFIPFLDDEIVSLTALTVIANSDCRTDTGCSYITQLTLSLYLMTQCQLKLHHSVTSLAQTLYYIQDAQRILPLELTLDQLTLKLIERNALRTTVGY